ncbi:MAG: ATP synthase F1 subunit delta [Myxococcota bacterium]|jgi:F-type H+-transporting ATPase subunit delta|nr:ATP synthase F1 subunit delta [Deltaproteobacteria bacterium]MCP4241050.1 ATP synthase F1 subunit delta [bacterium]MDP6076350.1 ATP synthase F1 subunit delta [Myxococcota bacterium]MDP6242078.1 ATP synthase F1 subunit delta [Myxococcota bacterium]MDP7074126.1 ATP synthase F1 subunit delta [Myxococcota bacterium]
MRSSTAARRYSKALFGLARDENAIDTIRGELTTLARLLVENREFRDAILRPLHPGAERRAVLKAVCDEIGTSGIVRNFCAFLIDQRRAIDFEAICTEYGELADRVAGRVQARIVSASALRDDQRERLRAALTVRTGQQVELDESVDPALLGGAVASVGGLVFDGSLRTQLQRLRASLTEG